MGTSRNGLLIHSVIPIGQTDQIRQLWYIRYTPQFTMVYQLYTTARAFKVVHVKVRIYIYIYLYNCTTGMYHHLKIRRYTNIN